uniref:uracil phosphoribosyltransferase n=1 Tax=Leptocylindrus danicus TaxID=163516 RepID=A0A7S2LGL4_9STRA
MANGLHPNLILSESKAYDALFTKMRDVKTKPSEFEFFAKRVMRILAEDAIAQLPHKTIKITTPCSPNIEGKELMSVDNICVVSIVRAGDSLMEAVRACLPGVSIGKILIQRNEETTEKLPTLYYSKLPPRIKDMNVLLCDPMLATGGSAKAALDVLTKHGVLLSNIIFVNVICCPEGLQRLAEDVPDVKVVTACVDECLNENKYIVPGLGDYGDRFFNTT